MNYKMPIIDTRVFEAFTQVSEMFERVEKSFEPLFKQHQFILAKINPIFGKNQELAQRIHEIIPKINPSIFDKIREQSSIFNSSEFIKMTQLQKEFADSLSFSLSQIDTSFILNLNQFTKDLENVDFDREHLPLKNIHSEIQYGDIKSINNKLQNGSSLEKSDLLTIINFIAILITLYTFFYPDNTQSIKTRQMIEQLEIKISTPKSQNIYYEVTKQVHVREYPSSSNKSGKLDILYPKHKLFIIQSKPYWIQVEYFNERLHETIIGWVSKRYTKKLSKENITK